MKIQTIARKAFPAVDCNRFSSWRLKRGECSDLHSCSLFINIPRKGNCNRLPSWRLQRTTHHIIRALTIRTTHKTRSRDGSSLLIEIAHRVIPRVNCNHLPSWWLKQIRNWIKTPIILTAHKNPIALGCNTINIMNILRKKWHRHPNVSLSIILSGDLFQRIYHIHVPTCRNTTLIAVERHQVSRPHVFQCLPSAGLRIKNFCTSFYW